VTADRDAFAKTKPCVEVFTGYQKWRKRGRKAGLGCNAARKMMKQVKGFSSHCGFFRRNNAGKKRVELSYEQAHSELCRQALRVRRGGSDDDDGTAGEQQNAPACLQLFACARALLLLPGDGRAMGVWERWAEEKGAHVLTAAVCAGAGRAATDRRRC
jgi:hypothetical protein